MKTCLACQELLPLDAFYRQSRQGGFIPRCKPCHNAKCAQNVRSNPLRKKANYRAKRKWSARFPEKTRQHVRACHSRMNPEEKRIMRGRSITLHLPDAPIEWHRLERSIMQLHSLIYQ